MRSSPVCEKYILWKNQKIQNMPHNQSFIIKGEGYTTQLKNSESYMKKF